MTMSKGFRFMKNSWVTTMGKDQGAHKVRGKVGDAGVIGRRQCAGAVHHLQQPGARAPGEPGSTYQTRPREGTEAWRNLVHVRGVAGNGGKRIICGASVFTVRRTISSIIISSRLTRAWRASWAELGMRDYSDGGNAGGSEIGDVAGGGVQTQRNLWRAGRH